MPGNETGVSPRSVKIPVARALADGEAGPMMNKEIAAQFARREAAKDAAKLAALEATGERAVVKGVARLALGEFALEVLSGPVGWVAGAVSTGVSCYFDYKSAVWDSEAATRIGVRLSSEVDDPTIGDRPLPPGDTMEFPGAAEGERVSLPSETFTDGVMVTEPSAEKTEPIGDPRGDLQAIGDPNSFKYDSDTNPLGRLSKTELGQLRNGDTIVKFRGRGEDRVRIAYTPTGEGKVLVRQNLFPSSLERIITDIGAPDSEAVEHLIGQLQTLNDDGANCTEVAQHLLGADEARDLYPLAGLWANEASLVFFTSDPGGGHVEIASVNDTASLKNGIGYSPVGQDPYHFTISFGPGEVYEAPGDINVRGQRPDARAPVLLDPVSQITDSDALWTRLADLIDQNKVVSEVSYRVQADSTVLLGEFHHLTLFQNGGKYYCVEKFLHERLTLTELIPTNFMGHIQPFDRGVHFFAVPGSPTIPLK